MKTDWVALQAHAQGLPACTVDTKWGADRCYSVGGKMFAVFGLDGQGKAQSCCFKVDDERFLELTGLPGIIPAPYLARHHWVALRPGLTLPMGEIRALLTRSHALVAAKLTAKLRRQLGILP
jgi:predicted DNA-binding protein (MmcQ/YjbR family)